MSNEKKTQTHFEKVQPSIVGWEWGGSKKKKCEKKPGVERGVKTSGHTSCVEHRAQFFCATCRIHCVDVRPTVQFGLTAKMDDRENLGHLSHLDQITSNGSFLSSGMRREQCSSTSAYLANASQGARRRRTRRGLGVAVAAGPASPAPTKGGRQPSPAWGCARGQAPLTASRRTRAICDPAYRRCSRSCHLRGTPGRCGPPCRSCSTTSGSGRTPVPPRNRGCRPSVIRHACRRHLRRRVHRGSLRGYRSLHRRPSGTSCHRSRRRRRHNRRCPGCRSRRAGLPAGIRGQSGPSCGMRSTPGYS